MPRANIRMSTIRKLFLILIFAVAVGACEKSSPPSSKQEAAPFAEDRLAQLQKQADSGNADAQFNLGSMYHKGEGLAKDVTKAFEWYQKAAAQGNASAQEALGRMYARGEGVARDLAKAFELLQIAATQGHANAQASLATMYANGAGVAKDVTKAFEWYQKAAIQGDAVSQTIVGQMYANGEGVAKDAAKAVEWYQKAAAQGEAMAMGGLGFMYLNGEGVPKDVAKAVEWYQKAAARGDASAQRTLGMMYYLGEGVSRNLVLAYAWHNLAAAASGHGSSRDMIEKSLTPAQRAEGQRLASNWKKGDILQVSDDTNPNQSASSSAPAKKGTGTAFIVTTEGHAITNHHVVAGCKELRVQGHSELVQVITRDSVSDLALLKMPGETRAAAALTPDPAGLRQGQDIMVFGFPLDSVLSSGGNLTPGVVSAITGLGNNSNQIQITAPIQPGSSGSPVMDKKGHVVGVVNMKLSDSAMAKATGSLPQNVNFAVNAQTLKAFLNANRVPYKTGGSLFAWEKSLTDLGDEARKWTTVVECWK
jgi:hypothetical protein